MTDLSPITALGAAGPWAKSYGPLSLSENTMLALASLSLPAQTVVPSPFGLTLPEAGQSTATETHGAFWSGPNQWMIEGYGLAETDFATVVKAEADAGYVTEQTDGWCAFDIEDASNGDAIQKLMQKLVNIDAHQFSPGSAARTGLEHMSVFVIRRSQSKLTVIGMRTLAGALMHALATAAQRLEA